MHHTLLPTTFFSCFLFFFGQYAPIFISYLPPWKNSVCYVGLNQHEGGTWNPFLMGEKNKKKKLKDHNQRAK